MSFNFKILKNLKLTLNSVFYFSLILYNFFSQVDESGFPQIEGLVRLYSEGVQDRNYYYATFTAVQQCIGIAEAVKQQQPNKRFGM